MISRKFQHSLWTNERNTNTCPIWQHITHFQPVCIWSEPSEHTKNPSNSITSMELIVWENRVCRSGAALSIIAHNQNNKQSPTIVWNVLSVSLYRFLCFQTVAAWSFFQTKAELRHGSPTIATREQFNDTTVLLIFFFQRIRSIIIVRCMYL